MEIEAIQEYRRARLKALIDSPEFAGNLSAVGRALGYQDGVYVRQMRDGVRAISEKTVLKIEALPNRAGWFATAVAPSPVDASESGLAMLAAYEEMADEDKREMLKDAQERAAKFRRLAEEAISRHTTRETAHKDAFKLASPVPPPPPAPAPNARSKLKYDKKNRTPTPPGERKDK